MGTEALLVVLAVLVLVGARIVSRIIRLKKKLERVEQAWADLSDTLAKRHKAVPPLLKALETHAVSQAQAVVWVKQFTGGVRTALKSARERTKGVAQDREVRTEYENELTRQLNTLDQLSATYPDVVLSPDYREAHQALARTGEDMLAAANLYNDHASDYNGRLKGVPDKWIAPLFSLHPQPVLDLVTMRGVDRDEAVMHQAIARG